MAVKKHSRAGGPAAARSFPPDLPKAERISDTKKISALFKNDTRQKSNCGPISITIVPGNNWEVAILVRKRVGSAVKRNYIKRKLRDIYRNWKPLCSRPYSVIFSVSAAPTENNIEEIPTILQTYTGCE